MIAATALGDIVHQPGDIENLRLVERLHELARKGQFVPEPREHQASQIANHEQRVFVDRERMEQVVLHAPDDLAEIR